jgi:plasmid stabilization system protein ParE
MKNTVIITDAAGADIIEQFTYIRFTNQEPINADRWLIGLYEAIDGLEAFAGYARAPESDLLGVEMRQKLFKSHRIIYSFDEAKHEVTIHYVRHGARRHAGDQSDTPAE